MVEGDHCRNFGDEYGFQALSESFEDYIVPARSHEVGLEVSAEWANHPSRGAAY